MTNDQILHVITSSASQSEKTSWNRKMDKMIKLLAQLQPLEQQIMDLISKKQPIFDAVKVLRNTMVNECIHPKQHLHIKPDYIECKFCLKKIQIPE